MFHINKCPVCGKADSMEVKTIDKGDPDSDWAKDEKYDAIFKINIVVYEAKCGKCGHQFGVAEKLQVSDIQ